MESTKLKKSISIAGVLELADKQASDTCVFNMRVQVPSPAPAASCRPQSSGGDSKNPNLITRWWGSDLSLLTAPNKRRYATACRLLFGVDNGSSRFFTRVLQASRPEHLANATFGFAPYDTRRLWSVLSSSNSHFVFF